MLMMLRDRSLQPTIAAGRHRQPRRRSGPLRGLTLAACLLLPGLFLASAIFAPGAVTAQAEALPEEPAGETPEAAVEADESAAAVPQPPAPVPEPPAEEAAPTVAPMVEAEVVPDAPRRPRSRKDTQVVFGGSVTVGADEIATDIVVLGGSIKIEGEVEGDAVAIGGSIVVNGPVAGDVVAVGGGVDLGPEARVSGEVTSVGGGIDMHPEAEVLGEVTEAPVIPGMGVGQGVLHGLRWQRDWDEHGWSWWAFDDVFDLVWDLVALGVLMLLACLALLLARGPVETIGRKAAADPLKSGLVGLLAQIVFFPLLIAVIIVLCVSIIGIPLLILIPFALLFLLLVGLAGYTAVAYRLAGWLQGRFGRRESSPYATLLVGVAIVEGATLIGDLLAIPGGPLWIFAWMFLLLGVLVQYLAWTVGFGAALMTRFGTADSWQRRPPLPAVPVIPPAPPAAPEPPAPTAPPPPPSPLSSEPLSPGDPESTQ